MRSYFLKGLLSLIQCLNKSHHKTHEIKSQIKCSFMLRSDWRVKLFLTMNFRITRPFFLTMNFRITRPLFLAMKFRITRPLFLTMNFRITRLLPYIIVIVILQLTHKLTECLLMKRFHNSRKPNVNKLICSTSCDQLNFRYKIYVKSAVQETPLRMTELITNSSDN